tara:strand:- start:159 stop:827 length:669 start_codon:yes stop_codon:yes gene_type:complete
MPFIGVQPASALLTSADIQDGQITTAKIADDAVGNTKLDLTANYAFTGTVSGTGMALLLDATISSAVSEYDISSTHINSTYDAYYLDASLRPDTDDAVPYMRPFVSGSVVTSGISYETYGIDNDKIVGDNTAYIRLSRTGLGNAEGEGLTINGHLQNINSTTVPFCFSGLVNSYQSDNTHKGSIATGGLIVSSRASVVNGLRLYFSSGNITSGTVKLYGLRT